MSNYKVTSYNICNFPASDSASPNVYNRSRISYLQFHKLETRIENNIFHVFCSILTILETEDILYQHVKRQSRPVRAINTIVNLLKRNIQH